MIERTLFELQPGVTEVHVRPAIDTPEIRSLAPDWAGRLDDRDLCHDDSLRTIIERAGATLIGYRALRDAMRHA